ncbi:TPA: hypothetical protein ACKP71_002493 [Stenotrophomonas maltophilia]
MKFKISLLISNARKKVAEVWRKFHLFANGLEEVIDGGLDSISLRWLSLISVVTLGAEMIILFNWDKFPEKGVFAATNWFSIFLIAFFCSVGLRKRFNSRLWTIIGTLASLMLWASSLWMS